METNPFDIPTDDVKLETQDELLTMIQFRGKLRDLYREFIDVFSTSVLRHPAHVKPMEIVVDRSEMETSRSSPPFADAEVYSEQFYQAHILTPPSISNSKSQIS